MFWCGFFGVRKCLEDSSTGDGLASWGKCAAVVLTIIRLSDGLNSSFVVYFSCFNQPTMKRLEIDDVVSEPSDSG